MLPAEWDYSLKLGCLAAAERINQKKKEKKQIVITQCCSYQKDILNLYD